MLKGLQRDIWAGWKDSPLSALGMLPYSDPKHRLTWICRKTGASSVVTQRYTITYLNSKLSLSAITSLPPASTTSIPPRLYVHEQPAKLSSQPNHMPLLSQSIQSCASNTLALQKAELLSLKHHLTRRFKNSSTRKYTRYCPHAKINSQRARAWRNSLNERERQLQSVCCLICMKTAHISPSRVMGCVSLKPLRLCSALILIHLVMRP